MDWFAFVCVCVYISFFVLFLNSLLVCCSSLVNDNNLAFAGPILANNKDYQRTKHMRRSSPNIIPSGWLGWKPPLTNIGKRRCKQCMCCWLKRCKQTKVCLVCFQSKQRQLNDLYVGSQVIAKHKNGRYYHATITEVARYKLYEVDFDDGSVSFDLLPEDIVVSIITQAFCTFMWSER